MNDKVQARKTVLVSSGLLVALAIYHEKNPNSVSISYFKRLWGIGVVTLILSIVADFAPQVAGPFAVLLVLGSLTHGGDQAIQNALGGLSTPAYRGTGTRGTAPAKTQQAATTGVTRGEGGPQR